MNYVVIKTRKEVDNKKDKIIRVGDDVKFMKFPPRKVVRWGYPMSVTEMADDIIKNHMDAILRLCNEVGIPRCTEMEADKLARELAYMHCRMKGFGGNERKLYFENMQYQVFYENFRVHDIKYVNLGERIPGGGYSTGWYGDYDYEPPYLSITKRAKLLNVSLPRFNETVYILSDDVILSEDWNGYDGPNATDLYVESETPASPEGGFGNFKLLSG